ncbi:MAG: ParB N-terminal domain-containing protein [Candidatus Nezhaarchaeales archaeon]
MPPSSFTIRHPSLDLELCLKPIEELKLHEETIEALLEKLKREIEVDHVLKHPVIVDRNTLIVLDGMHRVEALRVLGYGYVPVCLVNYESPAITLGSWARLILNLQSLKPLISMLLSFRYVVVECRSFDEVKGALVSREASLGVITNQQLLLVKTGFKDIKRIYEVLKRVESELEARGYTISYETERDAYDKVKGLKAPVALIPPTALKSEVISTALRGERFPHKTTRHIIPARPLFINVPLKWLTSSLNLKEAATHFYNHLRRKTVIHHPPGQVLDRRYEEETYVFQNSARSNTERT